MSENRILIVSLGDLATVGGHSRRLRYFARILSSAGFDVQFAGVSSRPDPEFGDTWVAGGVGIRALIAGTLVALRAVLAWRPAVVILTHVGSPMIGLLALFCRIAGARVLFDCQDPPLDVLRELYPSSWLLEIALAWIGFSLRIAHRAANCTFSVSPGMTRLLRKSGMTGRIELVYNVHGLYERPARQEGLIRSREGWETALIIAYTGGLQPKYRGIETQIEALAILRTQGLDARMVIAGAGDESYFREFAADCGVADAMLFYGYATPDEVAQIIDDSNIGVLEPVAFALPSKSFEYLYGGLRVLSTDGDTDVNQLFGQYVTWYDGTAKGLADTITRLFETGDNDTPARIFEGARLVEELRARTEDLLCATVKSAAWRRSY